MNDYLRLRQICLVAADLEQAVADIQAIFEVRLAYRDPHLVSYGVANAIFPFGLGFLEVVSPLHDKAPAARFLQRAGADPLYGGYMAIFNCNDPLARRAHAAALGIAVAADIELPEFTAAQLHPRDCRGAMIEFDHTPGEEDLRGNYYPAGGKAWVAAVDTSLTQRIAAIELASPEPQALGRHWAAILQREFVAAGAGGRIGVDMCDIEFAPAASGSKEILHTLKVSVGDTARVAANATRRGYRVEDNAITLCGVRFAWHT